MSFFASMKIFIAYKKAKQSKYRHLKLETRVICRQGNQAGRKVSFYQNLIGYKELYNCLFYFCVVSKNIAILSQCTI